MTTRQTTGLAMDGRMLARQGSGISTYATALRHAQSAIDPTALIVNDLSCKDDIPQSSTAETLWRWLMAHQKHTIDLDHAEGGLVAPDIYRLAHIRYKVSGHFLTLQPPNQRGIMHWSLPLPIRMAGWTNIYTVHDAIPLTHASLTPMNGRRHARLLSDIVAGADHLITVSESARADIILATGCPPERISNCSIAVTPPAPAGQLPHDLSPGRYFLFIGSSELRKNVQRVVAAYRSSNAINPLILVGSHETWADPHARIFCLPHQPANQLSLLIAHARSLTFPSLAEGFGLPVVEAMALGCATMTSNRGALSEVAGDAALLVDPENIAEMAAAFSRLDQDDALVEHLRMLGLRQAAFFSPARFEAFLSALYTRLAPRLAAEQ